MFQKFSGVLLLIFLASGLFAQTASRSDGDNVYYYETLHEAVAAVAEMPSTVDSPVEITVLTDVVLDEPLQIPDGVHIRLAAGETDSTIYRSGNLIAFPVLWVNGESASLTLGKPKTENKQASYGNLVIDGGWKNTPPIQAHCPLVNVCGADSKLIMYDNVSIQNNCNAADAPGTSFYQNGAGVFIRTAGDITGRQAEFIMKGGVIRGNVNDNKTIFNGGGVYISGFGIFTMEGGVIMDNTAKGIGGGVALGSRASFRKTGGIIYGSNAPVSFRNRSVNGDGFPKMYGHAVTVAIFNPSHKYRDDTVNENDKLSYQGVPRGNGVFGEGEKWDDPNKAHARFLSVIILIIIASGIPVTIVTIRIVTDKRFKKIRMEYSTPRIDYVGLNFTGREKEICELLLTDCSINDIAGTLKIKSSSVNFHIQNLYRKLDIQSRTELFVKLGTKKNEKEA